MKDNPHSYNSFLSPQASGGGDAHTFAMNNSNLNSFKTAFPDGVKEDINTFA